MSKKNMLCFIVVVLQVFAGVVFAVETHSSIYPLYFDKVASSPDANIAAQEEMWSRLLNFKLFGESHLEFSDRNISVPDEIGWTGTSNGDFVWGFNGGSKVGGPIVVSGDMIFRLGPDSITTGPVVVSGSIRVENGLNFSGKPNFLNVVHCVDGLLDDAYSTFVYDAGIFGLDDCPVSVPAISSDLSVPALYDNGIVWQTAINVNGAVCTGTVDAADGYCIQYIDVPPGDSPYDLYIEALETANHAKIIFRMPENGRLIRVFLKDGFYIANGIKIATMQMSSDAVYSDGAWNGEGIRISNSDYTGNLIFYTSKDITFPVFSPYDSIQGTFITPGSISIGSHLTFSGQLIAGNLTIDSDFDGSSFRYVPFDPPFHYVPYDPDFVLTGSDGRKINVTEDQAYTLTKADFPVFDIDGYPWDGDFIVRIISSTHGSLEIDGSAVTLNQDIPLAVLNGTLPYSLTYTPVADAYGDKNDSLEYRLKYGDILSAAYKMYFNVAPVNDAPIIEKASFTIKENSAFGSLDGIATGSVLVSDVDDDSFTYGFYDQFSDTYPAADYEKVTALLAIDAQTGVISMKEGVVLNYESADSVMTVPIIVTDKSASTGIDGDALSTMFNATIRILDVNESPFILTGQVFTIPENSMAGTTVLPAGWKTGDSKAVKAEDPDIETSVFGMLSYAIKETDTPFEINGLTGVISLKTDGALDYESEGSYTVTVVVTDGGELSDEAEIVINVIDVNEESVLTDDGVPSYTIAENSPNNTVLNRWKIKDPDATVAIENLSVSLTDKNESASLLATDVFDVRLVEESDSIVVELYVSKSSELDFESIYETLGDSVFSVEITLTDDADVQSSLSRQIVVSDVNEIHKASSLAINVDENVGGGHVLGTINVLDPDSNNPEFRKYHFSIMEDDVPFAMSDSLIVVADTSILDYEIAPEYNIHVVVVDELNPEYSDTADVEILLNDLDEAFHIVVDPDNDMCDGYVTHVPENSATGTVIMEYYVVNENRSTADLTHLNATLKDNGETGVDSLFGIEIVPAGIDSFKVQVYVKDGSLLDYETVYQHHEITLVVDDGVRSDSLGRYIYVVDVNEAPFIVTHVFAFAEHYPIGAAIGLIEWGDDQDLDGIKSVLYRENKVEVIGGDEDLFSVESNGVIKTLNEFDYETDSLTYSLIVKVSDVNEPDLFVVDTITINLLDAADPPYFVSVVASIDEHSPYQTLVGSVVAKDPDCNNLDKCVLSYEIVQGGSYVGINSEGYITILKNVDINYEEMNSFDVTIRVTDADGLFSDTVVTVVVNDVNEAPVIDDCLCRIAESEKIGAVVCKLAAKDLDESPKFNELEYTMISRGDDFSVSSDGLLKLNRPLDYESEKVYTVIVRVSDGEFADTAVVTVGVLDVVERSAVDITKFIDDEFTYEKPGVIYTHSGIVRFCWREGRSDETNPIVWGEEICADTSLVPGRNILVRSYYDATTNYAAADSVTVFYNRDSIPIFNSTVQPTITIVSNGKEILEDSCAFVKTNFTEISITVKDPVKSEAKDKDSVFTVEVPVKLKTTYISSKDLDLLIYTKTGRVLLDKLPQRENLIRVENSDFTFSVSFVTKINNVPVVIRYDEDENGEVLKKPVMNANGAKSSRPVIEILYVVPNVKENIKLSYFVDATTGEALYSDSQGRLMSGAAAANLEKSIGGRNTSGIVNVSYKQNLESGEPLDVAYIVDNDGNIIADEFDAECYKVSYTYTDAHNHSSTSSTLFVLDTRKPNVEIVFPKDGSVFTADSIGVVWTVDGKEQDSLTVEKLNPGMNVITRTVLDRSGEKYSVTISVVRRVENKEKKFSNYLVEKLLKKVKFKITLNGLEIDATAGSLVSVFDAQGNLVLKQRMLEDVQTIALPKEQNYIVRVGKTSQLVRMR